jgi:hypothetical protein
MSCALDDPALVCTDMQNILLDTLPIKAFVFDIKHSISYTSETANREAHLTGNK